MWGRLLMLAIGAAAGVLGKVFVDGYQAYSNSSSTGSSPSTSEDGTDSEKEAD